MCLVSQSFPATRDIADANRIRPSGISASIFDP